MITQRGREAEALKLEAQRAEAQEAGAVEGYLQGLQSGPLYGLAHGQLNERDAAELRGLKAQIQGSIGFRCDGYKEKCLRRRIAVRMRARGVHGFGAYGELLQLEPQEYAKLLEAVTINVSKFFRNAEAWERLRTEVMPRLFELPEREVRIWSAGCAAGEESYTLAMVLREYAEAHGDDVARFRILGGDIDAATLENARKAEYSEFAFGEISAAARERWFEGAQRNRLCPEIRSMVEFLPMDLIADAYPSAQHLILCRNVVIYFERFTQEAVFRRFHGALAPGGFLMLGKVEALFGGVAALYRPIAARERLFRKA